MNSAPVAQAIFASYFLLILGLFAIIWHSQRHNFKNAYTLKDPNVLLFSLLTVASFAHTWFYMFKFMAWSFAQFEASLPTGPNFNQGLIPRITAWLMYTDLFEQAWSSVCRGAMNWWWSEQLCLFTVGFWTTFLAIRGREFAVKHIWAYMLLGQVVAVSVASNIFYLVLVLSRRGPKRSRPLASGDLWACVLISLATVVYSPSTSERFFLLNLLAMHALILVPLITGLQAHCFGYGTDHRVLYAISAIVGVALRLRITVVALESLPEDQQTAAGFVRGAWSTLHSHPAQSSIGWDVVWTTISFVAWMYKAPLGRSSSRSSSQRSPSRQASQ